MTTVINNPGGGADEGSGAGLIIGVLLVIVLGFLFIRYGIPAIRDGNTRTTNVNVQIPAINTPSTGGNAGGSSN